MGIRVVELLPLIAELQRAPREQRTLEALSRRIGLSPAHLQRVFARLIGESPKRIATRLALERAAAELVTTQTPILDIALDSGFRSHEGFTRAFRREFDLTPRAYRARGLVGGDGSSSRPHAAHRRAARTVGPCVGLFGVRLAPARRTVMSYEIVTRTLTEQPILFMRKRIAMTDIADALARLLPAVYRHATAGGIAMVGPPFCRYADMTPGGVTIEAGLPVAAAAPAAGEILAGTLPAGPAATTVHTGPYDGLGAAHEAIEAWLAGRGLAPTGPPWESYLTDPGEVPDPAEWQTEVIWPANA